MWINRTGNTGIMELAVTSSWPHQVLLLFDKNTPFPSHVFTNDWDLKGSYIPYIWWWISTIQTKKKWWWWTPDNPCMISSKLPTWLACIQVGTARWSKLVCRRKSYANHLVVPTLMYHSFRLDSAKHAETIQSVRRLHETLWKFPGQILDLFSCFNSDFGLVHRTDQSSWILAKQK